MDISVEFGDLYNANICQKQQQRHFKSDMKTNSTGHMFKNNNTTNQRASIKGFDVQSQVRRSYTNTGDDY